MTKYTSISYLNNNIEFTSCTSISSVSYGFGLVSKKKANCNLLWNFNSKFKFNFFKLYVNKHKLVVTFQSKITNYYTIDKMYLTIRYKYLANNT